MINKLSPGLEEKIRNGYIGVDEAGRGCLAGPVCAAALYAPANFDFSDLHKLTDSKKLSALQRCKLEEQIKDRTDLVWGLGLAWPEEIDQINILNATFRAMSRAILNLRMNLDLLPVQPVLIDGPHGIPFPQWQVARKNTPAAPPKFYPVIKGDSLVPAISAASILAKEYRDRLMTALGRRHPQYDFAKHKGYGTKEHMAAVAMHGFSPQHRRTFGKTKGNDQLSLF